jgi:predicted transcriptional regulator
MIVKSQRAKKAIVAALADEDMMKIMNSVTDDSKSIRTIMTERNIAYTTAYRKTKWLLNQSLVVVERFEITPDGKKSSLVRSTLRSIAVKYEQDGTVFVEAEENVNALKKVMKNFFSLE